MNPVNLYDAKARLSDLVQRAAAGEEIVIAEAEEVYVSAATAWELGLKVTLGKLRLPETVEEGVLAAGFSVP